MPALFKRPATTIFRAALIGGLSLPLLIVGLLILIAFSPLGNTSYKPLLQPVEFDHRHHAGDDGIDCRYCHSTVEVAASAGYPSTEVCMNCHSQIWQHSKLLDVVRASYFTGKPIRWRKIHRLPDYVYFDHAIHVNKGVGCVSCHGRVDLMASVYKEEPLTMKWCLDCHRDPGAYLRPLSAITRMDWKPPDDPAFRDRLRAALDVNPRTDCYTCHR